MERIGRETRNVVLLAVCLGVVILGNLFIRLSYIHTTGGFEEIHGRSSLERARGMAGNLESRMRGLEMFLGAVAGYEPMRVGPMDKRMKILALMTSRATGLGVVDLFWIPPGRASPAGAAPLAAVGTALDLPAPLVPEKPPEQYPLIRGNVLFSIGDGGQTHSAERKGVMVIVPAPDVTQVTLATQATFAPQATLAPRPGESGENRVAGYLAALISLEGFVRESAGFEMSASRYVAIVSGGGEMMFHPDSGFVGAGMSKAMALENFPRLKAISEKMLGGEEGIGSFEHYDSREGKKVVRWRVAYAPVRLGGERWSLGIFDEGAGAGFARRILGEHLAFALVFSLFVAGAGAALYRASREVSLLGRKVRSLQDATALGGILRTVNRELSEAKQELETDAGEYAERVRRIQQAADRLVEACNRLGETVRHPSRAQKECMRDARFEASRLRGEIGRLRGK